MKKNIKNLAFSFLVVFVSVTAFGQTPQYKDMLSRKTVAFLLKPNKVTKLSLGCLAFLEVDANGTLDVREAHDRQCGGDPNTMPDVATFKLVGKRLYVYDWNRDTFVPAK